MQITPAGGRVIGCLVEKQLTTPQQYPLTRNALSLACSQSTNRDPVVAMDEADVGVALESLRGHRLVRFVQPSSGRVVERIRHVLDEVYGLDVPEIAVLAVLLLRGPQTPGEIRGRSTRMVEFADVPSVHEVLDGLASRSEPLVELLPRRPGQKEDRWRQLLAKEFEDDRGSHLVIGPEVTDPMSEHRDTAVPVETLDVEIPETFSADTIPDDRLGHLQRQFIELQQTVERLERELAALRDNLGG